MFEKLAKYTTDDPKIAALCLMTITTLTLIGVIYLVWTKE